MAKKNFECEVHSWIMKKGKKDIVYKAKKKEERETEEKKEKSDL